MSKKPKKPKKKPQAPAQGERNAISGYYPQYRLAAALAIRFLREEELEWVALADLEAGRVDDFQVGTSQRVDAFQIKWGKFTESFSYAGLTSHSAKAPSLIAQLADGWKRMRAKYPQHRCMVHLITNDIPSVSPQAVIPCDKDALPVPKHFAAFIEQAWLPAHKENQPIPTVWQTAWDELQKSSRLTHDEFNEFVRDCELEFNQELPGTDLLPDRDSEIYRADLEHATQKFIEFVASPQNIIVIKRAELLERLGWKARLEYRNRHYFPVDEKLYQPIISTRNALLAALAQLPGGYIAVLGTPGSGKSTLLTQTLRYLPERVIRYYAYVPDAQSTALRGESVNFLHDAVRALEQAGFRYGNGIHQFDRQQLLELFHAQIRLLHEDWQKTGRKTIVLVDGLDHIPREQQPMRSLLQDLPLPEQIPSGVYFVLGSQTVQLQDLPSRIQYEVQQPQRRLEMQPLDRQSVFHLIEQHELSEKLAAPLCEKVFQLSGGHPLALIYLLRRLAGVEDETERQTILQEAAPYVGEIEADYHSYWRQLEDDDDLSILLGLLARLRGEIDLRWVETWAAASTVQRLRRKFAHYFRTEDHARWYFFHNSFRLFLTQRTAESRPGHFDPVRDVAQHRELASICLRSKEARWQWEALYHWYKAGADEEILQLAQTEWFRAQLFSYRLAAAIQQDILCALQTAIRRKDIITLVRLMLAYAEIAQRAANLDNYSLAPLLLAFGEEQAAIAHLRDGRRLRASELTGLNNAVLLYKQGLANEARQLFDLSEPLELLSGVKQISAPDHRQERTLLKSWVGAAGYFRPVQQILTAIRQIQVEPDRFVRRANASTTHSAADAPVHFQNDLIFRLGLALLAERRWEALSVIEQALLASGEDGKQWCFFLRLREWHKAIEQGKRGLACQLLNETIARFEIAALNEEQRLVLAESVYRLLKDETQTRALLQEIELKITQREVWMYGGLRQFDQFLRLARLHYALGERRSPTELIPHPVDSRQQGIVYFHRGLCTLAWIWSEHWQGRTLDIATLGQTVFPLLRLFNHNWIGREWDSWYELTRLKDEFYERLIEAVAQHGQDGLFSLAEQFMHEWQTETRYWTSDVIRPLVLALRQAGLSKAWAEEQLEQLEPLMAQEELPERIKERLDQTSAWLKINRADRARVVLAQTMQDASSVGSKDFQMSEWIYWLRGINQIEPESASPRFVWFAQALIQLETNGGQSREAACELLKAAFTWSPRRAIRLFTWLLGRGLIHFDEGARRLLASALAAVHPPVTLVAALLTRWLLPICRDDDDLVENLLLHTQRQDGEVIARELARTFIQQVSIQSLPSNRKGWRRGVARAMNKLGMNLATVSLCPEDLKPQERGSTDTGLQLKDGNKLGDAEVIAKASSLEGLRELMQNQAGSTYYYWREVLAGLIPKLDSPESIQEVAGYFRQPLILAMLAQRLSELGEKNQARNYVEQVLREGSASGWVEHLDGGTRLAAFKALQAIDKREAEQRAWATLAEDMMAEYNYLSSSARNLSEIVPLLFSVAPIKELWAEIEPHIHALFPNVVTSSAQDELSQMLTEKPEDDHPAQALADLLGLFIAHPVHALAEGAQQAALGLLLRQEACTQTVFQVLLDGGEREQENALMVIDALSHAAPDALACFRSALSMLAEHPNYGIRTAARDICHRVGYSYHTTLEPRPLPTIYSLDLPPGHSAEDIWHTTSTPERVYLPETDDPYELLFLYLGELEVLAEAAGIPATNVIQRAAQHTRKLAPTDVWMKLGEEQMRLRFERAGLKYPYRRPRATIARRALWHVVAELSDAGYLDANVFSQLLAYYDPQMLLHCPMTRPSFVPPMLGDSRSGNFPSAEAEVEQMQTRTDDGFVILGELTEIQRLQWEMPKIKRQSRAELQTDARKENGEEFFYRKINCLTALYPTMNISAAVIPLVIRCESQGFDSPGAESLAFNPALARKLGWVTAKDSLFGWQDRNGALMAYSLWWRDGLIGTQPPKFDDDVGEGWLVLASQIAWEQLATYFNVGLLHLLQAEQSYTSKRQYKQSKAALTKNAQT